MKLPILITGASGGGVGRQCIKALRLGRNDYTLIATDVTPTSLGLFTDVEKAYLVPMADDPTYIPAVLKICDREKVKAVIPGSEVELQEIAKQKSVFEEHGIVVLSNNFEVIQTCLNKWETSQFLQTHGLHAPKTYRPEHAEDAPKDIRYPVVIKPYIGGGGSRGVYIAQNAEELQLFVRHLINQDVSPIVQEYVGSPEEEYTVGVLHSLSGELLGSFALKRIVKGALSIKISAKDYVDKNKSYVVSTGISQGIVDDYPEVRKECERIASALHSTGPINIQCRVVDGKVYVFEINPRFSGTTSIRALCGYNEPETLIDLHILQKKIPPMHYKKGTVLRDLENCYIDSADMKTLASKGFLEHRLSHE